MCQEASHLSPFWCRAGCEEQHSHLGTLSGAGGSRCPLPHQRHSESGARRDFWDCDTPCVPLLANPIASIFLISHPLCCHHPGPSCHHLSPGLQSSHLSDPPARGGVLWRSEEAGLAGGLSCDAVTDSGLAAWQGALELDGPAELSHVEARAVAFVTPV